MNIIEYHLKKSGEEYIIKTTYDSRYFPIPDESPKAPDGCPGEEGPSGTGAEGLPAAGRDRFSIIALQRVCLPDRLDGLEGTDRPSRKSLDGSAGQSLADDRFFLTSASGKR